MNHGRANWRALSPLIMTYTLRKGLHYCCVGGQIVFMDLRSDAYFLLKGAAEKAFRAYLADGHVPNDDLQRLLAHGLLAESDVPSIEMHRPCLPVPLRSASELAPPRTEAGLAIILEVAQLVYATRRRLRTRNIGEVLEEHLACCRVTERTCEAAQEARDVQGLTHVAGQYRAARRFVPVETSCLLDSLALRRFLARRGHEVSLVFGVNAEPFSAHAWLQLSDLALNETVSYARMHTPILVL